MNRATDRGRVRDWIAFGPHDEVGDVARRLRVQEKHRRRRIGVRPL